MTVEEKVNIITEISKLVAKLGWGIAVPDQDSVDHLIVGKVKVIENLIQDIPQDYDILEKEDSH